MMMQMLTIIAGAAIPLIAILAAGSLIARRTPLPGVVRFTNGAAAVSSAVFFLLLCHAGYTPVFVGLAVALVALAKPGRFPALPHMPVLFRALVAVAGTVYLVCALAPEIQPDATGYHLRLVADYARLHALSPRNGFYDVLPQGMEMLYVPAFGLGGASAAKLVHFAFLLATIPLIRLLALEAGLNDLKACAAAALFFLAPVCAVDGTSAYTDAGLVCACCSVVWLLLRWNRERSLPLLLCAALQAGFCYSVKPTFAWVLVCATAFTASPAFAATALLFIAPWLFRAALLSGSVTAPFLSHWLPNSVFTPEAERRLTMQFSALRPDFSWLRAPFDYTLFGANQGVFGPAFLLLPLAALAIFKPARRWVPVGAALLAVPVLFNTGTRFLMPAMALVSIGIAAALPHRALLPLVAFQALAAMPGSLARYALPGDWHLREIPVAAALRIEPEDHYLRRTVPHYEAAVMLGNVTPQTARIFAFTSLPEAYAGREVLTWWHSRRGQQFADALRFAMESQSTPARLLSWRGAAPYRSVRLTALSDLRLLSVAVPHSPERGSWAIRKPGEAFAFAEPPGPAAAADFLIWPGDDARAMVEALPASGNWRAPDGTLETTTLSVDLRRDATAYLRRSGYRYLAVPTDRDPFADIGSDMVHNPDAWGLTVSGQAGGIVLFHIAKQLM